MMQLSDLAVYAREKYHMEEQRRWADLPGLSVLTGGAAGKWLAVMMRRWDTDVGAEIQLADIRCGRQSLAELPRPYLSAPYRMGGQKWVGVRFGADTEPEVVCRLFDRAVRSEGQGGCILILPDDPAPGPPDYRDTPLPAGRSRSPLPEPHRTGETAIRRAAEIIKTAAFSGEEIRASGKLWQRGQLYARGDGSFRRKCESFLAQGRRMAEWEDDTPWQGDFRRYYPTYRDLSAKQLRGYFTWRAAVRRGEFRPVPVSLAYIYIYELLNGIGTAGPEDSLAKLRAFEQGYIDSSAGDPGMRKNLRRWMLELAVVSGLPPETARQYADEALLRQDEALAALKKPGDRGDREIFQALCELGSGRPGSTSLPEAERHLFARVWRRAAAEYREEGKSLFTVCFGPQRSCRWEPLGNAVWCPLRQPAPVSYELDECRKYIFREGRWREQSYRKQHFDKKKLDGLLCETERQLRLYLGVGRRLKENPEDAWAAPYIEAVIEEDRRAKREAARAKVSIRFGDLDRIRADAAVTRESLLTEEERREAESPAPAPPEHRGPETHLPLDAEQLTLMAMLLRGESVKERLAAGHGMPTVVADGLNEALFDLLRDSAVECCGDDITLVEDYREEISRILGGHLQ